MLSMPLTNVYSSSLGHVMQTKSEKLSLQLASSRSDAVLAAGYLEGARKKAMGMERILVLQTESMKVL